MIHFGHDNFTVTLALWPQFSGETYTVATALEAVHTRFTTNTSVQLVMLYNTQYDINITATLCGCKSAINFTTIHYGNFVVLYNINYKQYCEFHVTVPVYHIII